MAFFPTAAGYRPTDPMLRGFIGGLANANGNLIADALIKPIFTARMVDTSKGLKEENYSTGTIQRFKADAWFGDPTSGGAVGPGGDIPEVRGAELDPMTYAVAKYPKRGSVPREVMQDAQLAGLDASARAYAMLFGQATNQLQIEKEQRYATLLQTEANWSTNTATIAAGDGWNNTGSDPIGDLNAMFHKISAFGSAPTDLVLPRQAVIDLQTNAALNEFRATTGDRTMLSVPQLVEALRGFFGFVRVHLGMGIANTSPTPGTLVTGDIWTDSVWMGSVTTGSSLLKGNVALGQTALASVVAEDWSQEQFYRGENQVHVGNVWYRQWEGIVMEQLGGLIVDVHNTP